MRRTLAALAVAVLAGAAGAAPARPTIPKIAFEKYTLPNGLQVILHVDKKLPIVHVNLWYHVGSKNERLGRTGFAHLFEHMMLQGAKNASTDFFSLFARIGARGGRDSNGSTDDDHTSYFSTAPSGALEFMLWVHSDYLATLPDALTQQKLDNQRDVVRNERRETENQPYGKAYLIYGEPFYGKGHPYSWPTIGYHEDLVAASLDDVKTFFRTYYAPNNLSLAITGDFDPAQAKKLVEKYFGSIPPGPPLERPRHLPAHLLDRREVDFNDRVAQERVYLIWPGPAIGEADENAMNLAAGVLGTGLTSRLQKALVYDTKLASDVSVDAYSEEIAGSVWIVATARDPGKLDEIERVVDREIARLAKQGPTPAEVERVRARIVTGVVNGLQDIAAFGGKADVLNRYNTFFGDPGAFEGDLARLLAVTPADVKKAVATYLDTPHRLVMRAHPETSSPAATPEPDRSKEPPLAADSPWKPPVVASGKLDNGLELYVVERPDLPIVTAALVARAGSAADPEGKEGLANLTAQVMRRGTKKLTALALQDAFADLGTELTPDAGKERTALVLTALDSNLLPALTLLSQVAREPAFPEAEVARERTLAADGIARAENSPQDLALRLNYLMAYGPKHPLGHPVEGFRRTVETLTRADLVAFHEAHWRPKGSALVLVGNISLDRAKELAGKAFASWSGETAPAPALPPPAPPYPGKLVLVDRPDASQTYVLQALDAPARIGDDYAAWRLAGEVLGANAAGRLYLNLRQDKGYSYGVRSSQQLTSGTLAWFAYGGVQTDKTKESVVEFAKEASGIGGARPITKEELETRRQSWLRAYAATFLLNIDVARRVVNLWAWRAPMTFLADEPAQFAKASLAEVQAAGKRYAVPAQSTLLLVGDRRKIEAGVRSLKLGEVILVDADGRPLAK